MAKIYMLVASDVVDYSGEFFTSDEAARKRLENKVWPVYQGTANKNAFKSGDKCVCYLAGKFPGAQHFIGEAEVESLSTKPPTKSLLHDLVADQPPVATISFSSVELYEAAKPIKPLLDELSFIPSNRAKWGSSIQGGCRALSQSDYELIMGLKP